MKVIDQRNCKLIRRLSAKPKYFSRCESKMLEKKTSKKPPDVSLRYLLEEDFACEESSSVVVRPADKKIEDKMKVGFFTLDHAKTMRIMRRLAYYAKCQCGSVGYFTADEIVSRYNVQLGCLLPGCEVAPIATRLWYHVRTSLALQIAQADTLFPEQLTADWRNAPSPWEAGQKALNTLAAKVNYPTGRWWFGSVKLRGLVFPDEVVLTDKPDKDLFPKGQALISLEGEIMTVEEAALSFGRKEEEVLTMKLSYWDIGTVERLLEGK